MDNVCRLGLIHHFNMAQHWSTDYYGTQKNQNFLVVRIRPIVYTRDMGLKGFFLKGFIPYLPEFWGEPRNHPMHIRSVSQSDGLKFLLHFSCHYLTSAVKIPHRKVFARTNRYRSLKEDIWLKMKVDGLKMARWTTKNNRARQLGRGDVVIA